MRYLNGLLSVAMIVPLLVSRASAAVDAWGLESGKVELKSAGALTFGPEGIFLWATRLLADSCHQNKRREG